MQSNAVRVSSCIHPKTIQPSPCTVTDVDALVRVNPSSADLLKEATVNDMGRILDLQCFLLPTEHSFNHFF